VRHRHLRHRRDRELLIEKARALKSDSGGGGGGGDGGGNRGLVRRMLAARDARRGDTALILACKLGDLRCVEALARHAAAARQESATDAAAAALPLLDQPNAQVGRS
jgi:hypothetical protein